MESQNARHTSIQLYIMEEVSQGFGAQKGVAWRRKPLSWELGVMQKASRYILIKPHTRGPKFPHRVECVRQPNGFVVVS